MMKMIMMRMKRRTRMFRVLMDRKRKIMMKIMTRMIMMRMKTKMKMKTEMSMAVMKKMRMKMTIMTRMKMRKNMLRQVTKMRMKVITRVVEVVHADAVDLVVTGAEAMQVPIPHDAGSQQWTPKKEEG